MPKEGKLKRDIYASMGYKILIKYTFPNSEAGSMLKMKEIYLELLEKIKELYETKEQCKFAQQFASRCLEIRDKTLPKIMEKRWETKENQKLYNLLSGACSFLLDDLQTWWNVVAS